MKKEIKSAIISATVTIIITFLSQYVGIILWGDHAKIELISSDYSNSEYLNVIAVKNIKKEEYLSKISIEIDNNIKINDININNDNYKVNNIIDINKISPNKVSMIIINSNKKITKNDITIIKNNHRVSLEYFNNITNYNPIYMLLLFFYFIADFIVNLIINRRSYKQQEKIQDMYIEAKNTTDKIEKSINKFEKKDISRNKLFLKEMNDKDREIKFYQQLLLKNTGQNMSKEELEQFIMKNLKSFNKRKIKYFDYNDILKIITDISEDN